MTEQSFRAFWGCAVTDHGALPAGYAKNITLRQELLSPFDGTALRFHFSNRYGTEPVTLSEVTVGESEALTLIGPSVQVTFGKSLSVILEPGEELTSDEINISVRRGASYSVSVYLGEVTQMKTCVGCSGLLVNSQTSYGNLTKTHKIPIEQVQETGTTYFLTTADVLTNSEHRSIIAFGDSITSQSWPDFLSLRALEEGSHTAVIRRGVSGSRVLRQYNCASYLNYGKRGEERFAREIDAAGADTVIVLHGINDLIHPDGISPFRPMCDLPTAEELIEGLRFYAKTAHAQGKKIYIAPILPFEGWRSYDSSRNEIREQVNEWIRSTDEIDGIVEFDQALRQQNRTTMLQECYDSGDHLHPSEEGGKRMAQAVPDELIW